MFKHLGYTYSDLHISYKWYTGRIIYVFSNGIEKKASCIIVPLSDTKELKLKWQENKPLKIIIHGWRNLDDLHVDFIKNGNIYIF